MRRGYVSFEDDTTFINTGTVSESLSAETKSGLESAKYPVICITATKDK